MDEEQSKLRKAAKDVRGRAIDWLQHKLQPQSQENRLSQTLELPLNASSNEIYPSECQAGHTYDMSPPVYDRLRLTFEVGHFLLSPVSVSQCWGHIGCYGLSSHLLRIHRVWV
jgi:hypothetical protein